MIGIDLQGETEHSLVAGLRQGRQEAMGLLYDAYAPVMMGMICSIIPQQEAAEEVLHETFVAIWSRIGEYDASRSRFLSWGLSVARGIALEAVKNDKSTPVAKQQRKRNFAGAEDTEEVPPVQKEQEDKLLCRLEPLEKAILELIYLKGRSCTEAAAALGITEEMLRACTKKAFIHIKAEKSA